MTTQKKYKVIGIMSGTSMDGLDCSYLETDGKKFVSELNKGQTSIVERYNYYNDGNTASRIFDILLKN